MLFKGTATRSAEDIAQQVDSLGGHLGRVHVQGIRRLLHQGPRRAPADRRSTCCRISCCNPAFDAEDVEREKKVILEEIKMVEDTPDDLVHELFTQSFWDAAIRWASPILGTPETVEQR